MSNFIEKLVGPQSKDLLQQFDDHIYPYLAKIHAKDVSLSDKLQLISDTNGVLFKSFIKRINGTDHFHSSFWRLVNIFAPTINELQLELDEKFLYSKFIMPRCKGREILWLIKGPFNLAHMDIVKNYIHGFMSSPFRNNEKYHIIFLDAIIDIEKYKKTWNCVNLISLRETKRVYDKVLFVYKYCQDNCIDTVLWPGVFQDYNIYMGIRMAPQQIFWSAKHKAQIFNETVDKYFYGGFSKRTRFENGALWRYGRFDVTPWKNEERLTHKLGISLQEQSNNISQLKALKANHFQLIGSLCQDSKYLSVNFWRAIAAILKRRPKVMYVMGGTKMNAQVKNWLNEFDIFDQVVCLGWVEEQVIPGIVSMFDIYADAFPFGSSSILYSAWINNIPTVGLLTSENLNMSFMHSINGEAQAQKVTFEFPGVERTDESYIIKINNLLDSSEDRTKLSRLQKEIAMTHLDSIGMYEDFYSHIIE